MRLPRRRCLHRRLPTLAAFIFLLLSSASVISLSQPFNGVIAPRHEKEKANKLTPCAAATLDKSATDQKTYVGPGSSPPSCRSKCGWCAPCEPVHVPIKPGLSFPLEYYPEAWRCKCGNKLFNP